VETELPVRDPTCLYLYGIVPAAPLELSAVKGVEGGCDVSLVGFEDLACAVSPVPLSEYGEQGMTAHAQELDWIAPRALRHQDVVQRLRQAGPVIPLKFGALRSTREKVREMLQKHHQPLLGLLERLRGREEWGVRVYADPDLASRALEGAGPGARAINQGMSLASEGEAYFLRKRKQQLVSQQQDLFLSGLGDEIYQRLLGCVVDGRKSRFGDASPQTARLTVLKAAFLVDEQEAAQFQSAIGQLEADYRDYGVTIELSGPWAPYSFCGDLTQAAASNGAGGAGAPCAG